VEEDANFENGDLDETIDNKGKLITNFEEKIN
jgi:hypothetical protein